MTMMDIPEVAPLSDMKFRQTETLERAKHKPVMLIDQGTKPAGVILSVELWKQYVDRFQQLERVRRVDAQFERMKAGEYTDLEEVIREVTA